MKQVKVFILFLVAIATISLTSCSSKSGKKKTIGDFGRDTTYTSGDTTISIQDNGQTKTYTRTDKVVCEGDSSVTLSLGWKRVQTKHLRLTLHDTDYTINWYVTGANYNDSFYVKPSLMDDSNVSLLEKSSNYTQYYWVSEQGKASQKTHTDLGVRYAGTKPSQMKEYEKMADAFYSRTFPFLQKILNATVATARKEGYSINNWNMN